MATDTREIVVSDLHLDDAPTAGNRYPRAEIRRHKFRFLSRPVPDALREQQGWALSL